MCSFWGWWELVISHSLRDVASRPWIVTGLGRLAARAPLFPSNSIPPPCPVLPRLRAKSRQDQRRPLAWRLRSPLLLPRPMGLIRLIVRRAQSPSLPSRLAFPQRLLPPLVRLGRSLLHLGRRRLLPPFLARLLLLCPNRRQPRFRHLLRGHRRRFLRRPRPHWNRVGTC